MRRSRKSTAEAPEQKGGRLLLHLGPGVREAIEADEVYFVEAKGDDTEVRTRGARVLGAPPRLRGTQQLELHSLGFGIGVG